MRRRGLRPPCTGAQSLPARPSGRAVLLAFALVLPALHPALARDSRLAPGPGRARAVARHLRGQAPERPTVWTDSDLIVGYPDSNEVRTITGGFSHVGRIIVLNNGTLVFDSANATLRGDIWILDRGTVRVREGTLTIAQSFAYQYGAYVMHGAAFSFDRCRLNPNGVSWGAVVADSALMEVTGARLVSGFVTLSLVGAPSVSYTDARFPSEFVVFDSCRVTITRSETALLWLGFPDASTADIALPATDTVIRHWRLRPDSAGVSGIGYTVTLDSVADVMWGSFPLSGCSITIRDSRLRAVGLMMSGGDSVHVSGLVNNQHHADYLAPLADRRFRVVNTHLRSWNFYLLDSVRLAVESSVFGELLTNDDAAATVTGSICDGSGGYLGAEGSSLLTFSLGTATTQVTTRDRAVFLGVAGTFRFGSIDANGSSTMLFALSSYESDPNARDTGTVLLADFAIPPGSQVETDVPITGTADLLAGPHNPLRFGGYRLCYAPSDSPPDWRPVGPRRSSPVYRDTLETWDTRGLVSGRYLLRLTTYTSAGDSIDPIREFFLGVSGLEATPHPDRQTPNRGPTIIRNSLSLPAAGMPNDQSPMTMLDASGRRVMDLQPGENDIRHLAPGVYFVRTASWERSPEHALTRKAIIQR